MCTILLSQIHFFGSCTVVLFLKLHGDQKICAFMHASNPYLVCPRVHGKHDSLLTWYVIHGHAQDCTAFSNDPVPTTKSIKDFRNGFPNYYCWSSLQWSNSCSILICSHLITLPNCQSHCSISVKQSGFSAQGQSIFVGTYIHGLTETTQDDIHSKPFDDQQKEAIREIEWGWGHLQKWPHAYYSNEAGPGVITISNPFTADGPPPIGCGRGPRSINRFNPCTYWSLMASSTLLSSSPKSLVPAQKICLSPTNCLINNRTSLSMLTSW